MPPASLVIVNYRSAPLAIEAIRSARATTQSPLQVIVVDNSDEADVLRPHADILIAPNANLGYGAAINRARRHCDGEFLIAANADVRFGDGAIGRLIESGADLAGPALFWDDAFSWILPPSDLHTTAETFDAAIASRSARWARSRDRHRVRNRIAFWSLTRTTEVPAVSGAILAIRTSAFDRAGGFDERFHLYFEEIDLQRRLRHGIAYVPAAKCRHVYNQSAAASQAAAAEYARSEMQYLSKWSGARVARMIKSIERPRNAPTAEQLAGDIPIDREGLLVEASPLPSFDTAAGHFPNAHRVAIPEEVWRAYQSEVLYLRVVEAETARVMHMYAKTKMVS
ncbi:MAG TPA: glycosyltransferase [Thermoanaerobaculia bacterium]|nr:glycosyltransferase [Thermoanaerobaculia bacterium]